MQMAFDGVHGPRIWEGNTRLQNRQKAIIKSTKDHSYHNQWKQNISYICEFRFELCCLPVSIEKYRYLYLQNAKTWYIIMLHFLAVLIVVSLEV